MAKDGVNIRGIGYQKVETSIFCVLTRFEVKSTWALFRFYRQFKQVRREAADVSGLLASLFVVENRRTCYTLSIWRDAAAVLAFNTQVKSHIDAANACFKDLAFGSRGPRLWSAQFSLSAVSPHNLRWDALDVALGLASG